MRKHFLILIRLIYRFFAVGNEASYTQCSTDPECGDSHPLEGNRLEASVNSTHSNTSTASEASDALNHSGLRGNFRNAIKGDTISGNGSSGSRTKRSPVPLVISYRNYKQN